MNANININFSISHFILFLLTLKNVKYHYRYAKLVNIFRYRQKILPLRAKKVYFLQKLRYLFVFAEKIIKFVSWKQKKIERN